VDNLGHADRRNLSRNLDSSFLLVDERGNIIPKTPEAAQAYLFTTQPTPGDTRESMHRAALQGLGLVGSRLKHRGKAPRRHASPIQNEGTQRSQSLHVEKSPHRHNSTRHGHRSQQSRSPSPRRNNIPRHGRVSRRSRSLQYAHDNKDAKIEMGHHVSLAEFIEHRYPKDSSYPMTSRSMTNHRNHNHCYQIICKQ
jgi:hypothetical protein